MDGYVIIGTKLDNSALEKDLNKLEKKMRVVDEELGLDFTITGLDKTNKELEKIEDKAIKTKRKIVSLNDGFKKYDSSKIAQVANNFETSADKALRLKQETAKAKEEAKKLKQQTKEAKIQAKQAQENFKNIGNSTSNIIKKVGRWALAIFSVRSAYMFIRQLSGTLAQYNQQYGANLEYLRYMLAQAVAPILEYLVNLAYKLLSYVNYIAQAWFGIDLFSRATAKNFSSMAGSASKIQKSLAGFDEMNILNENGTTGALGGVMPNFNFEETEKPKWLKWIADNKDIILGVLEGIGIALGTWKLTGLLTDLGVLGKSKIWTQLFNLAGTGIGLYFMYDGIKGIGEKGLNIEDILKTIFGSGVSGFFISNISGVGLSITLPITLAFSVGGILFQLDKKYKIDEKIWKPIYDLMGEEYKGNKFSFSNYFQRLKVGFKSLKIAIDTTKFVFKSFKDEGKINLEELTKILGIENNKWISTIANNSDRTGKIVIDMITGLKRTISKTNEETIKKAEEVTIKISEKVQRMWSIIKGENDRGLTVAEATTNTALAGVSAFAEATGIKTKENIEQTYNSLETETEETKNTINNKINSISSYFSELWRSLPNDASMSASGIKNSFSGLPTWFRDNVTSKMQYNISKAITGGLNVWNNASRTFSLMGIKLPTLNLPRLAVGGIINMPRKRSANRRSNRRRSRSRRCNSFN